MTARAGMSPGQRRRMAELADTIAPGTALMPSASAIGLALEGSVIDRVLALRRDLAARVLPILDGSVATPDPATFLDRLERETPGDFLVLMEVVSGAYYLAPEVRVAIGYFGQEALSLGRGEIGGEDLLAAMMQRPPRWRGAGDTRDGRGPAAGAG